MMAQQVMVTGASGLLGRAVMREFEADTTWQVHGLAFSRTRGSLRCVDLTDPQEVEDVVADFKPTVVIHCAAERRPDVMEKNEEQSTKINVQATEHLCQAAGKSGAWVLFISTDYVFDGSSPPYKTTDAPNPLNKYGHSKLQGENVVLAANPGNVVLRVPILYGPVESLEESAVTVLFSSVRDTTRPCKMSDYERRYPTSTADVAEVIRKLCQYRLNSGEANGIFHWSGDENMTKYDMAMAMAQEFGLSADHIQADKTPSGGASRPYDAHLDCSRLEGLSITSSRRAFRSHIREVLLPFWK